MKESDALGWPNEPAIERLRASFLRMIPACESVSDRVYQRLFEEHPGLRELFPPKLETQKEKLIQMLATSIDLLSDPAEFRESCRNLGTRHDRYGAEPEHYPLIGEILIEEVSRAADPPLTALEAEDWTRLYNLIASEMLTGSGRTGP